MRLAVITLAILAVFSAGYLVLDAQLRWQSAQDAPPAPAAPTGSRRAATQAADVAPCATPAPEVVFDADRHADAALARILGDAGETSPVAAAPTATRPDTGPSAVEMLRDLFGEISGEMTGPELVEE